MTVLAEKPTELKKEAVQPLEEGDRLDQPTFHARYEAMPGVRAELIGGIVYMPSPMKRPHSKIQTLVSHWLQEFEWAAGRVEALSGPSIILDDESEPEPDAVLRIRPSDGGATQDVGDYVTGIPELVVEISSSTVAFDLGEKKDAYEQAGVPEYLVLIEGRQQARWFVLENGRYAELQPDEKGVLRSRIFPGLWLRPTSLFNSDNRRLRRLLREGIASKEHREWVERLAAASRTTRERV